MMSFDQTNTQPVNPEENDKDESFGGQKKQKEKSKEAMKLEKKITKLARELEEAEDQMKDQLRTVDKSQQEKANELVEKSGVKEALEQSTAAKLQTDFSTFIARLEEKKDDSIDPEAAEREPSDTEGEPTDLA